MTNKMKYRLGLDLGTTSIGWAMIRLDADMQPCAVIRMGSRIFSDGRNPKDGASLAVTRRNARQMRRRRDRLLQRKQQMQDALIRWGFFPADAAARHALTSLDPYALRDKGLREALTGAEFARALFHINQRRGFLSNRKTDKKDKESGALKSAIKELRQKLSDEGCLTLGQWLSKRHAKRESVRARLRGKTQKERTYDFYADRAMIEHEFDTLWSIQTAFNPTLFTDQARAELKDVLLFQRPLKPVKPGRCSLLPDEERAPLALPSTQRFRILQELNNLRMIGADLCETPLTLAQRNTLATLLEGKDKVTFSAMLKTLKISGTVKFNLEEGKRDSLKGNATSASLAKKQHFGELWHHFNLAQQDEIVWQLLNEASESRLTKWLMDFANVDEQTAIAISSAGLPEGYGGLSRKALAAVLPPLASAVVPFSDAVRMAGFDSHSLLGHAESSGEILDALPYYGQYLQRHVAFAKDNPRNDEERYGKIANPTVHIGLNELRKVVNALIQKYGRPTEIVVEVARELKQSKRLRDEIQADQKLRQQRNERLLTQACDVLGLPPEHLDKGKRRELSQRMQLWEELNRNDVADRRCPYTGEQISIARLLSEEVEIEHILPFSQTLDDSLKNKTVALRRANRDKGNQTPFKAFGEYGMAGYDYNAILERARHMPREKAKRFAPDGLERWLKDDKDFLPRALNDTAYLSKVAKEYLSLVCSPNRVRCIPGRMTAMLRGKFGLNQLLSGSELKNRNDHRHHALDAAVIAITDQGLLQRFASASAHARELQLNRLVEDMPLPWATFREHVARALERVIVSHRPDHGYQGAMHEDTAWGLVDEEFVRRWTRPESGGTRVREVRRQQVIRIAGDPHPERHGLDEAGNPKAYKGYKGGSNYCLEVFRSEENKPLTRVISTFDAYQVIRAHGEEAGMRKLRHASLSLCGRPLIARYMINDMVQTTVEGHRYILKVSGINSAGVLTMCLHNEANVDSRNRDKDDPFAYTYKTGGSLLKMGGRRISVSPVGDIRLISAAIST